MSTQVHESLRGSENETKDPIEAVADTKATDTKATDTKATDTKATDTKATDTKATDTKATDTKATDTKATDPEMTTEGAQPLRAVQPAVDVFENDEELLLRADLPGVAHDDVDLSIESGKLSIVAPASARGQVFRRAFALPEIIDPSLVDAELSGGVLTVHLKKREEMMPRRVSVRAAS